MLSVERQRPGKARRLVVPACRVVCFLMAGVCGQNGCFVVLATECMAAVFHTYIWKNRPCLKCSRWHYAILGKCRRRVPGRFLLVIAIVLCKIAQLQELPSSGAGPGPLRAPGCQASWQPGAVLSWSRKFQHPNWALKGLVEEESTDRFRARLKDFELKTGVVRVRRFILKGGSTGQGRSAS